MEDSEVKDEAAIWNSKNIIDIKQMTNKMKTLEVLKLINEELKIYDDSDINPFKIDNEANKLLIKQSVCVKSLDNIEKKIYWDKEEVGTKSN